MANDPKYTAAASRADKLLEPDGSIKTMSGTVVSGPSASGAAAYANATARADKLLEPDGSVITASTGGGGSTSPGGAAWQIQYNNGGVFGGSPTLTTDSNGDLAIASPASLSLGPSAPATSGSGNLNSAQENFTAGYWNGSSAAIDVWQVQNILGTGTTPTSTLTVTHALGSTGTLLTSFPSGPIAANSGKTNVTSYQVFSAGYGIGTDNSDLVIFANPLQGVSLKAAGGTGQVNGTTWLRVAATRINLLLAAIPIYANNAAAITGGLTQGSLYRTGADPDVLCIVH